MRAFLAMVGAGLLGLATPASAALVQLSISGTLQGTNTTIMCPMGPSPCYGTYPTGQSVQNYTSFFSQTLVPFDLKEGDNDFTYGMPGTGPFFTGIINNSNGVLTGRDLFYSFESGGVRSGTVGSNFINARATSFSVAPVPEPATWALMLLGFLAVGTALRQQPRRAVARAAA